ncbi:MAG: hypothetical protein GX241_04570 [Ruminococcaceae bacterium]|nr:hypothetical protein [Oscillospiraceae bacterium]
MNKTFKNTFKIIPLMLIMVFLSGCIMFKPEKNNETPKEPDSKQPIEAEIALEGPYDVISVKSADTIVIEIDKKEVEVLLIGISAPATDTMEGSMAKNHVEGLIAEKPVYLEYDKVKEYADGTILAYVYLNDKTTMIQKELLKDGAVEISDGSRHSAKKDCDNVKYEEDFKTLQEEAKNNKYGIWEVGATVEIETANKK